MEERRVYSLNLIAYVAMATGIEPDLRIDENTVIYAVFPEDSRVAYAIHDWKSADCQVNIHGFLAAYRNLRRSIKEVRGV